MEDCGSHCRDKSYLWDVTPCSVVVEIYHRFVGEYCLLRQGRNLIRAAKKGRNRWMGEKDNIVQATQ
jgi:hypothetical protein